MSLVPDRYVWATFTTAAFDTRPGSSRSAFSRASPVLTFVSRSIAVSTRYSPCS